MVISLLESRQDIGFLEVLSFKQKRLTRHLSQSMGEAVAKIQGGWMAAFAKVVECLPGHKWLFQRHGFDHNADSAKEGVQLTQDFGAELPLNHQ